MPEMKPVYCLCGKTLGKADRGYSLRCYNRDCDVYTITGDIETGVRRLELDAKKKNKRACRMITAVHGSN